MDQEKRSYRTSDKDRVELLQAEREHWFKEYQEKTALEWKISFGIWGLAAGAIGLVAGGKLELNLALRLVFCSLLFIGHVYFLNWLHGRLMKFRRTIEALNKLVTQYAIDNDNKFFLQTVAAYKSGWKISMARCYGNNGGTGKKIPWICRLCNRLESLNWKCHFPFLQPSVIIQLLTTAVLLAVTCVLGNVHEYSVIYQSGIDRAGVVCPLDNHKYKKNDTAVVLFGPVAPDCGTVFAGWRTGHYYDDPVFQPGQKLPIHGSNIELYAVWEPLHWLSVSYQTNTTPGKMRLPVDDNRYKEGEITTILRPLNDSTDGLKHFIGWKSANSTDTVMYKPGDALKIDKNYVFVAVGENDTLRQSKSRQDFKKNR